MFWVSNWLTYVGTVKQPDFRNCGGRSDMSDGFQTWVSEYMLSIGNVMSLTSWTENSLDRKRTVDSPMHSTGPSCSAQ